MDNLWITLCTGPVAYMADYVKLAVDNFCFTKQEVRGAAVDNCVLSAYTVYYVKWRGGAL